MGDGDRGRRWWHSRSLYTTYGPDLPKTLPEYIPAVPMLALAVAGMWMTFVAQRRMHEIEEADKAGTARPTLMAGATTFLMFGVV